MNLTKEQLEQLEKMGYDLITPEMAAINLEVDEVELKMVLSTIGSPARRAYYRGYIRQLIATREAVIKAAHNGSNPAQLELMKAIKTMKMALTDV